MFNLDQTIKEWRAEMFAAGIKSSESLDELESHLRDDVEQQVRSGLSEEGAFEIAVGRIGPAAALKAEFANCGKLSPTVSPNFLRNCCAASAAFILVINAWTLSEYELNPLERSLGFTFVALSAFYIGGLPYLNRLVLSGSRKVAARKAIILVCYLFIVSWEILAFGSAVQFIHLPTGITFDVLAWNLFAAMTATLLVLWYGRDDDSFDIFDPNFLTPTARESLEFAGAEALRFYHNFIGTEHLLLGLLGTETGTVSKILTKLGASRETVRAEIKKIVGAGPQCSCAGTLPYTPRAKKSLELAAKEIGAQHGSQIGPEQIFLGLILEGSGVAAVVLKNLDIDISAAREAILKEAGSAAE